MKKALIILYYWPPAGGSAVQRWLKFCKYLPEFGWEPVVYAPENAQYPEVDSDLLDEVPAGIKVIKRPIIEPFKLYKKFVGIRKEEKLGASMTLRSEPKGLSRLKNKLAFWVRSNFFIPDARMFWISPSARYLEQYLITEKFDVIITTGPPQSLQLIGYNLHKRTKIPWVADFRDPWTSIDFYQDLDLTRWADRRHHQLEARVLKTASHVIAIGPDMKQEFERLGARDVTVITNGFDDEDIQRDANIPSEKFTIVHLGTLSASRNVPALWKVLAGKVTEEKDFAADLEIKLYGSLDHTVVKDLETYGLHSFLEGTGFVSHQEAIKILQESHLLLLLINRSVNAKGVITGKFFEYLATGRPILLIGPQDGDAAAILRETGGGFASDYDDEHLIRQHVDHLYNIFKKGEVFKPGDKVERFTRRALTGKLAETLNGVVAKKANTNA